MGTPTRHFIQLSKETRAAPGHSACDAILADNGRVDAQPALNAANVDAALIHEAAIGKIAATR